MTDARKKRNRKCGLMSEIGPGKGKGPAGIVSKRWSQRKGLQRERGLLHPFYFNFNVGIGQSMWALECWRYLGES